MGAYLTCRIVIKKGAKKFIDKLPRRENPPCEAIKLLSFFMSIVPEMPTLSSFALTDSLLEIVGTFQS